jgi:hypothetical protein
MLANRGTEEVFKKRRTEILLTTGSLNEDITISLGYTITFQYNLCQFIRLNECKRKKKKESYYHNIGKPDIWGQ